MSLSKRRRSDLTKPSSSLARKHLKRDHVREQPMHLLANEMPGESSLPSVSSISHSPSRTALPSSIPAGTVRQEKTCLPTAPSSHIPRLDESPRPQKLSVLASGGEDRVSFEVEATEPVSLWIWTASLPPSSWDGELENNYLKKVSSGAKRVRKLAAVKVPAPNSRALDSRRLNPSHNPVTAVTRSQITLGLAGKSAAVPHTASYMAAKPEALPAAHTVAVTGQADDRAVRTRFLLGEIFVAANGISRFNRSFVQAFPRARNKLLEPDDKHAEPAELYRLQQIFECRYFTTLEQASLRLQGAALALDSIVRMVISKESASVYGGSEHPHFRVLQRTIFLFSWILTDLHEKVKQSKDYKTVADCSKSQPAVKDALDILNRIEAYLAPVSGLAVSVKVPIAAYVSVNTWLRLTQLQLAWPDHPIFATVAAPESKIPSCQYFTKSQSSCWYKRSFEYGRTIERNYLDLRPDTRFFSPGDCWWRKRKESAIAKTQGLARPVDTKFRMHRLLAFLAVRTWESWELWLDTKKWFTLHDCHNGFVGEANHPAGCANGLFHLHFGTDRENRLQKRCKLRDRSQCPGHGANRVKCIYVHIGSGTLKPCLNGDAQNPPPAGCLCKTPCFVRRVEDSPGSWQYLMTAD